MQRELVQEPSVFEDIKRDDGVGDGVVRIECWSGRQQAC